MTVVFKLGGSLLTHPRLADALRELTRQRPHDRCLLVVGGGASTDVVREWSQIHSLSEEQAHWLAIASLELNMLLVRNLLNWNSVASREQAEAHWLNDPSPLLLEIPAFAHELERHGLSIPHSWDVTSDSLAAWVAQCWPADELVLVKSIPAPRSLTPLEASRLGLVDAYFPKIAGLLRQISWCNLRAAQVELDVWTAQSTT